MRMSSEMIMKFSIGYLLGADAGDTAVSLGSKHRDKRMPAKTVTTALPAKVAIRCNGSPAIRLPKVYTRKPNV
jgi:hypothetical protein